MLTPKQQRFVSEYIVDFHGTNAAIRAGYSKACASSQAYENLNKPQIKKAIEKSLEDFGHKNEVLKQRVINELAALAFNDIGDLYSEANNENITLADIKSLSRQQRAAIKEIRLKKTYSEEYGDTSELTLKITSKEKSLELLGKHLGIFNERVESNQETTNIQNKKMTFEEFCLNAGYPKPFEKQIEMMEFGFEQNDQPRLLLGSRGYGKTDYVTIMGTAYSIYLDPENSTTLLVTKSQERNSAILSEIGNACKQSGMRFEIENSSTLRSEILSGKDHSISALTINSTGFRGRHPYRVIMDDPVTPDDTSEATRRKVKKVYDEVYKLTKNILIIGQPVHKFDLYATLRPQLKKMEVPYGSIPELDVDLEAQRLAGVDEESIQASYHLKIIDVGTTPFDKIRYMDKFPKRDSVAFIDPSFRGGDYTAITIVTVLMEAVCIVGFEWQKAWNHCLDDMAGLLKKYKTGRLAFETNSLGYQPLDILRSSFPGVGVVGIDSNTNKHSRIMQAGAYAHMIHLCKESHPSYIKHVVEYEAKSKYDDAPDSLASALMWIGLIKGKESK